VKALVGAFCASLLLVAAVAHGKATIVIVNADDAGVGFNDPTPVAAVGGNCGTTLGAQRLVVFQKAAEIWGNALDSQAPITVLSHFTPLQCDSSGATLGSAGPTNIFASDDSTLPSNVPGSVFPKPHTWYVSALTAAFAGVPVVSGTGTDEGNYDISAKFNATLDEASATTCGFRWYYGLDANHGDKIDLLETVLHEFGHGLGFFFIGNSSTGAWPNGEPDIWSSFLYDENSGQHWVDMSTNAARATSAVSGALAWDGPSVKSAVPELLASPPLRVNSAPPGHQDVVKVYQQTTTAQFSGPITATPVTQDVENGSTVYGCSALGRLAPLTGKIAVLTRGGPTPDAGCTFVEKARNAQDAGAVALLIANNTTGLITPAGDAPDITIPVLLLTQDDGSALQTAANAGTVNATIGLDPNNGFLGADGSHRAFLFSPATLQPASSVSHWDTTASPNLLMEPIINPDLNHSLDLTLPLFQDIGWTLSDGGTVLDAGVCGPSVVADAGTGGSDGGGGGGGGGSSGGCTAALGPPAPWLALLGLLALARRRRRHG
jgi:MYXO-CTERM domain-containing protein